MPRTLPGEHGELCAVPMFSEIYFDNDEKCAKPFCARRRISLHMRNDGVAGTRGEGAGRRVGVRDSQAHENEAIHCIIKCSKVRIL